MRRRRASGAAGELQPLWAEALETEPLRALLAGRRRRTTACCASTASRNRLSRRRSTGAGGDGDGVEMTICARDFEIHVDLFSARAGSGARPRAPLRRAARPVPLLDGRERRSRRSCSSSAGGEADARRPPSRARAGSLPARLTSVPGSSEVFLGGIVSYANAVKESELGVPAAVLEAHGAVSRETAAAMARGARERLGADVAVSVTGIAGPGGGTPEKPVGLVYLCASGPAVSCARTSRARRPRDGARPGDGRRLHLVRSLVTQS